MEHFDPTEFLAMTMSEDQNAVIAASNDIDQPSESVQFTPGTITVEGGLQMEQDVQIHVPTFGTLEGIDDVGEIDYVMEPLSNGADSLPENDDSLPTATSSPVPSPAERTSSPHITVKKVIPATYDETRFRKELFSGNYERVKLFRLHCTICSKHLGCAPYFTERQMRMHKLLSVVVCRKCFEFYGDINFPIEEGSELYCCWCGEGGELFCCSTCPKTVCKKCIEWNFGTNKVKEIDENDNWSCFVCKPMDIWPHRALLWGLQRFGKEMRQRFASLPKEEKIAMLSKDTSHCCAKINENFPPISLPFKYVMVKVPLCLIAARHIENVKNQPEKPLVSNFNLIVNNASAPFINNNNPTQQMNHSLSQSPRTPVTTLQRGPPHPMIQQNLFPQQSFPSPHPIRQLLYKNKINKSIPYAVNRQLPVPQPTSTQPSQYLKRFRSAESPMPSRNVMPEPSRSSPHEVIDLVDESPMKRNLIKTQDFSNDISWLEKNVKNVSESLYPIRMMLDQFNLITNDLKQDFSKIECYSDKLSHNIKIAICNLAKINHDLIEDKKLALDKKTSSIVDEIQMNGFSHNLTPNPVSPNIKINKVNEAVSSTNIPVNDSKSHTETSQEKRSQGPEQHNSSTSEEDSMAYVTPALLCEAVLEVEGNKENQNGNKCSRTNENSTKNPKPVARRSKARRGGRSVFKSKFVKSAINNTSQSSIHVIDLLGDDDDRDESLNSNYYCKKFNIKPCKVVIEKCKIN